MSQLITIAERFWEMPNLTKAKLMTKAAITIRKIMPEVRAAARVAALIISMLYDIDSRSCPAIAGYRSPNSSIRALVLCGKNGRPPLRFAFSRNQNMIGGPELLISARTNAPVTPNAAASVGVAIPM